MNKDGTLTQFWEVFKSVFVEIFRKNKENELYKQLGVKKGVLSSLKYMFFIFVTFPLMLFKKVINLDYQFYLSVEKMTLSILWLFKHNDLGTDILGKNYQKFVKAVVDKTDEIIMPDLSGVQSVVNFYRGYKLIAIITFVVIYLLITIIGIKIFSFVLGVIVSKITATAGIAVFGGNVVYDLSISVLLSVIFGFLFEMYLALYFGYTLYVGLKLILYQIHSIMYIKKDDYIDFLFNAIDFEILKTKELFGEDIANKAFEGLVENFVLKDENANLINADKLINFKQKLLLKGVQK